MNLLFCIDQKFLGELVCCLKSIEIHGGFPHYHVYVIHSTLPKGTCDALQKDFAKDMTFHFVEAPEYLFADFPVSRRYPKEIYYRLAAPLLLPKELDRILYLDADTVVINPLQELYSTDFEGNYYAACTHTRKLLTRINQTRLNADKNAAYVNTGVLLMNLPLLRENLDFPQILAYAKSKEKSLVLPDQDILSGLYGDHIKLLDTLRFNLSDRVMEIYNAEHRRHKIDPDWVRENTVIVHYCGSNKPWHMDYVGKLGVFYRELLPESCGCVK